MSKFGEALARVCSEYWVAKMTYLFDVWTAHEQGNYVFTEEDLKGFVEPEAFGVAFVGAEVGLQSRFAELRALRPAAPR